MTRHNRGPKEIGDTKASPVLNENTEIIIPCSRIADDHASPSDDGRLSSSRRTGNFTRVFGRSEPHSERFIDSNLDSRRNDVRLRDRETRTRSAVLIAVSRASPSPPPPPRVCDRTYTRCARPGGCACTALCSVPVLILPYPHSHSHLLPGRTPRKRARTRSHAPSPSPRPCCLSLARCLAYVWCVTVSVFHSFLFPSVFRRQTIMWMRPRNAPRSN